MHNPQNKVRKRRIMVSHGLVKIEKGLPAETENP